MKKQSTSRLVNYWCAHNLRVAVHTDILIQYHNGTQHKLEQNGVMENYHRSGNKDGKVLCISGNILLNFGNILRISCG